MMERETDGQTLYRYIDHAAYQASSVNKKLNIIETSINILRKYAQVAPAGPAPTTAISKSLDVFCTKHNCSGYK